MQTHLRFAKAIHSQQKEDNSPLSVPSQTYGNVQEHNNSLSIFYIIE